MNIYLLSLSSDHVSVTDFSHVGVTEPPHSLFDPVLVGLDTHKEYTLSSVFFTADSVVRGYLMTQWSNLLLQGARFQGRLGCLQNRRATVPQCVDAFQHCFPGLHSLCLGFSLVRPRGFCLCFEQDRGECKQAVLSRVVLNQAGVIQGI